jgi:hypothetical protein
LHWIGLAFVLLNMSLPLLPTWHTTGQDSEYLTGQCSFETKQIQAFAAAVGSMLETLALHALAQARGTVPSQHLCSKQG